MVAAPALRMLRRTAGRVAVIVPWPGLFFLLVAALLAAHVLLGLLDRGGR